MDTDAQLYELFRDHPEWIADSMNDPFPEPAIFRSVTIKKIERRLDGLLIPKNSAKPLRVIEFQFFPSKDIYLRATEERIAVHRLYPGREVEAIIFFGQRKLDERPEPWTHVVNAYYLDEQMTILAQRQPDHPLPKLLAPVFEKDNAVLEAEVGKVYQSLGRLPRASAAERENLQRIYFSFLLSRFKTKTSQEIIAMFNTIDATKTRAGREFIAMGKAETLLNILQKRLGKISKDAVSQIEHLDYIQLEKLEDRVLDFASTQELGKWLKALK
jgi:predicted transposase YdaD